MRLLNILKDHTLETICMARPEMTRNGAERLFEVHVALNHFAMPIHSTQDENSLISLCESDENIAMADDILHFEDTKTIRGISRVMVRTHLNRSGMNDISMGSPWKTQSPRVLSIFDTVASDNDLMAWANYTPLVDSWLQVAHNRRGNPRLGCFDEDDIESLNVLRRLTPEQALQLPKSALPFMPKPNWERIVRGVFSGMKFLVERYQFDAGNVWRELNGVHTLDQVNYLADEAQRAIREYGSALAPSFYADLGNAPRFVKPNTHVVDVTRWVRREIVSNADREKVSNAEAVNFVNTIAHATGLLPRQVDKYMFFACSCNMYLAGIKQGNGFAGQRKDELRRRLIAM